MAISTSGISTSTRLGTVQRQQLHLSEPADTTLAVPNVDKIWFYANIPTVPEDQE